MPRLTARSFAEMIHLPGYEQQRILVEQKYPTQGPSVFRIPYYLPALRQIKSYYSNQNSTTQLRAWIRTGSSTISPDHKRTNNIRVVNSFLGSTVSSRILVPSRRPNSFLANPHQNVELKLNFDIDAVENGIEKFILINPRNAPIDRKIAEDTIQIAFWIMSQNAFQLRMRDIEYWDLNSNNVYIGQSVNPSA
jgi:hypothetical protein